MSRGPRMRRLPGAGAGAGAPPEAEQGGPSLRDQRMGAACRRRPRLTIGRPKYALGFDFDIHINGGPAAYEMADAVYRLADEDSAVYDAAEPAMPGSFREDGFLDMVAGRSKAWLDAANTMLALGMNGGWNMVELRDRALELTRRSPEVVDDALDEIKRRGMLRGDL